MTLVLLLLIVVLQLRLWGAEGRRKVEGLEQSIAAQRQENERLRTRNAALAAEVRNLKEGREAIEERARAELGLVAPGEVFHQVIGADPTQGAPHASEERRR
ncbi:MAG: cell division protein FtsB [Xanthomonadales bacterium]|nr:cell division protein FtsB [Xanthomonadales bacterium]